MLKKLIRGLFSVAGLIIGYVVGDAIAKIDKVQSLGILSKTYGSVLFIVLICLLFGLIFYLISPAIYTAISNLIDYIEKKIFITICFLKRYRCTMASVSSLYGLPDYVAHRIHRLAHHTRRGVRV